MQDVYDLLKELCENILKSWPEDSGMERIEGRTGQDVHGVAKCESTVNTERISLRYTRKSTTDGDWPDQKND